LTIQLEGQLTELAQQRDAALARTADAESGRQAAEKRLQDLQDAGQSERETLTNHVRAVEDRAHAEVDRARQESKELKGLLADLKKERASSEKSHIRAAAKAAEASRQAEIQRARADALEDQLARLRDLPAALEATLRRSTSPLKPRKSGTKKAARRSGNPAKVTVDSK